MTKTTDFAPRQLQLRVFADVNETPAAGCRKSELTQKELGFEQLRKANEADQEIYQAIADDYFRSLNK